MPKKHLAIEIHAGAVRFVKLDGSFVVSQHEFNFSDKQDYRYNAQLSEFLEQAGIKEIDFDETTISWADKHSTLVPSNVFNESNAKDIIALSYGNKFEASETDYNRIIDPNVVNVHYLPFWLKSFFVVKFPRIIIQHEGTHLLRGLFKGTTFKLKALLVLHEDYFQCIIVKENNLCFYSTFEFSSIDDIIYYFCFTLQQKEWFEIPIEVVMNNGVGSDIDLEQLTASLKKVIHRDASIQEEEHLIAKYQQLCV